MKYCVHITRDLAAWCGSAEHHKKEFECKNRWEKDLLIFSQFDTEDAAEEAWLLVIKMKCALKRNMQSCLNLC